MSGKTNQSLADRWSAGDAAVIAAVLEELEARFARRLSRKYGSLLSFDECQEVVLIAVEQAWEHRTDFTPARGTLKAWLWRIVDHAAADEARKPWCQERLRERRLEPEKLILLVEPRTTNLNETPHADCQPDDVRLVILAMHALSQTERSILWADACSSDGVMTSKVLARELGLAASTVRRHRQRAKAKLRVELTRLGHRIASAGGARFGFLT